MIWWCGLGYLFVIFNCFYIPFLVSFKFDTSGTTFTLVINIFFALDILLSLRTAYYNKGLLITDPQKILRHNINANTGLDVLALFMGVFYLFGSRVKELKYLTFFTLVRGFKLTPYIHRIEDHYQFSRVGSGFIKLMQLLLFIFIMAHVSGCVFYIVANSQEATQPQTWIRLFAPSPATSLDNYIISIYWAFATMITVGYGDIYPTNLYERIFTIMIMVIAGCVFGYVLNTIGQIVDEISETSAYSR